MIVNYNGVGWQIITQRAHGLLAGQVCARWKLSNQPAHWVETLTATAEHDDIYNEFERDPLIDENGAPINFKATRFDLDATSRLMDMALTKSRFVALLLSRHIAFTHGEDPLARSFLSSLKKQEKKWMKEAGVSASEADSAYQLLEFCDAFSLLICQGQIPPENRHIEISSGPDGVAYSLSEIQKTIVVKPWPFDADEFTVRYETRTIKQLKFKNNEAFRAALKAAPIALTEIRIAEKA
ncbi:DUF3891 family protein [Pedobacter sp. BMA]|uniref:DUF3891 family protein n=1 Tax=Pedobacter sp. BMA TaxID=1663685 RepID=UPI000649B2BF|nr:DUF3891 family protein [Pedobacter sp. BMA]KLT65630.1 hypothetical protein AB669_11220 [Pedobacter sp. BMA]